MTTRLQQWGFLGLLAILGACGGGTTSGPVLPLTGATDVAASETTDPDATTVVPDVADSMGPDVTTSEPDSGTVHAEDGIPFVVTIHMEAWTSRPCDVAGVRCKSDDEFAVMMDQLEQLLDSLDHNGLKGTFEMQIHWLTRLQLSQRGLTLIDRIVAKSHEIGVHHHGYDHNDWDGYTDNPDAYLAGAVHYNCGNVVPQPMSAFAAIVAEFQNKYGVTLRTVEGTDLVNDRQPAWIYTTSDSAQSDRKPIDDPSGACDKMLTDKTRYIALPSSGRLVTAENQMRISFPHTPFEGRNADCQRVLNKTVLAAIAALDPTGVSPTDAVHLIFHVFSFQDDGAVTAYGEFFKQIGAMSQLMPMTVSTYACQRMGVCP